jgi:hypothetical protein
MGAPWARHAVCESALRDIPRDRDSLSGGEEGAIGCTARLHRLKISRITSVV